MYNSATVCLFTKSLSLVLLVLVCCHLLGGPRHPWEENVVCLTDLSTFQRFSLSVPVLRECAFGVWSWQFMRRRLQASVNSGPSYATPRLIGLVQQMTGRTALHVPTLHILAFYANPTVSPL